MDKAAYGMVWLLVASIPLENALTLPGIGTLSRIVGILALAMGAVAFLALRKNIRLHLIHWVMLLFVLLSALSFFWSIDPENTFTRILTYSQLLLMMWLIYQWCDDEKRVQGLYLAFLFGSMGLSAGVLQQLQTAALSGRVETYNFNPNEIASILALSIPFAWYLFLAKSNFVRWIALAALPVAGLGLLLTGSRGGLIKGVVGLLFILATAPKIGRLKGLVLTCLAIAVIGVMVHQLPDRTWERLMTTEAELASGNLGGRGSIWSAGMEVFGQHPILGVGAGGFRSTMTTFFPSERAPHNVLVSILVDQGLVGLTAFLAIVGVAVWSVLRFSGLELRLWLIEFTIWGASIMTCNWEWRKQMWLFLVLAVSHAAHRLGRSGDQKPKPEIAALATAMDARGTPLPANSPS